MIGEDVASLPNLPKGIPTILGSRIRLAKSDYRQAGAENWYILPVNGQFYE